MLDGMQKIILNKSHGEATLEGVKMSRQMAVNNPDGY
jgi:hypothetical protein